MDAVVREVIGDEGHHTVLVGGGLGAGVAVVVHISDDDGAGDLASGESLGMMTTTSPPSSCRGSSSTWAISWYVGLLPTHRVRPATSAPCRRH